MLRITAQKSATQAKRYFRQSDYYAEGQELAGRWHGGGAARLGLTGLVRQADFDALCDNLHPATGERLTVRTQGQRRVGFDLTFDVPKDVSVLHALTGDARIEEAFRVSIRETMSDIEAEVVTRTRRGGLNGTQPTGNVVWAEFCHRTGRPTAEDGKPDPHLHIHAYVLNSTFCAAENRWQAVDVSGIVKDSMYWRGVADARLAARLNEMGYATERRGESWGIAGVPQSVRDKFSRRTREVEEAAKKLGITDQAEKAALGAKTRHAKDHTLGYDELRVYWQGRLTEDERDALTRSRTWQAVEVQELVTARQAVEFALSHTLTRDSIARERDVLAAALRYGVGSVQPAEVKAELDAMPLRRASYRGHTVVTTPEVLREERRMLDFARDGAGRCAPLSRESHTFTRAWLNQDQKRAVEHVLTTTDRVTIIRGGAGVGKTSLMAEAGEGIAKAGKRVVAVAPTAAARDVLRHEAGFPEAQTLAYLLLQNEAAHESLRGQVLWADEASLIGARDMARLFDLAERTDCRVVLSGDTAQHHAVARGDALRVLQSQAGVRAVEVREIVRQTGDYKRAVAELAAGETERGFAALDKLGWIRVIEDAGERRAALTAEYEEAAKKGSVLVVAPTHAEGDAVTESIRARLRETGRLSPEERTFRRLVPLHWTQAEKQDVSRYVPGENVLHFHQNAAGGIRRGTQRTVTHDLPVPVASADRYEVFKAAELALAEGDRVRITANGTTKDGRHRLTNGSIYTVSGFTAGGDIVFKENGWVVPKEFGFLAHGYAVTSYSSQGRTQDRVIIAEPTAALGAASREQFYVSVSRGRVGCTVYTDDKQALAQAVAASDQRVAASEVWHDRAASEHVAHAHRTAALHSHYQHEPVVAHEVNHERG